MISIVFDLDGTLIHSAPAIQAIGDRLLAERGLQSLTTTEARSFIGNGAAKFVERAFAARGVEDQAEVAAAVERFERYYVEADPLENAPMPEADTALRALIEAGFRLGRCTNKPGAPTRLVIEALGWTGLLPVVVAGDSLPVKKPDPAPLLEAQRLLGGGAMIYVGDSEVDAEAAERASAPFLLYSEGYRKSPAEQLPHRAAFSDFADLPELVRLAASEM